MSAAPVAPPDPRPPTPTANRIAFWFGPLAALACVVASRVGLLPDGMTPEAMVVTGIAAWMAAWWIFEAVPIAATSLLPMVAFPLLGVAPMKAVVQPYMHPFIVLMMAGFMAALAIERWNLHRRVAMHVLARVGTSPPRLVLGMMLAIAVISMWISNTAATLMLLPVGTALVRRAEQDAGETDPRSVHRFGTILFLGLAYASSLGGLATPIGTPPNLIFMATYGQQFPDRPALTFVDWVLFALPLVVLLLPLVWLYLTRVVAPLPPTLRFGSQDVLQRELRALGPMDRDERAVALVFGAMALLWVTRQVRVGDTLLGWAPALGLDGLVDDATVAVLGAVTLFVWPSRTQPGERLLDWPTARRIPWDVVLLFGGGVALAGAFESSGLSAFVAQLLAGLADLPGLLLVLAVCLVVTFLTEVTSNTATATILLPVLAAFARAAELDPLAVLVPATLSASCAFMLPVATPPNAVVYGTGRVTMREMARAGVALNLSVAVAISVYAFLVL